jgi:phosphoribosylamine---glycine ligase
MKILVIGSGGREHALIWKLRESQHSEDVFCAPGNAGIAQEGECIPVDVSSPLALLELAESLQADLTVVGPEAPLVGGVADEFEKAGLAIIGPTRAAARLEGSKIFAKQFMQRHGIPTAKFAAAENFEEAIRALAAFGAPVVIKADGLAAGKGVVVARDFEEAEKTLDDFMRRKILGPAGERVVIESCLSGDEMSFIVMTDGRGVLPFAPAQDHKAVFDNDQGPNTGGMGAFSDDLILDNGQREDILRRIVRPTLAGMEAEGAPYRGFLYCGLMLTAQGPKVLEYNVRLGDPETQPTLMRLRSDLIEHLMALHDRQLAGLEAHWSPSPSVCVVLASKGYPGKPEIGKEITGIEAAESVGGVKIFHAGTAFHGGKLLSTGGRVMGVTAIGEDLPAAIDRAYAAVAKIQFEGMHYRRDIGARRRNLRPQDPGGGRARRADRRLSGPSGGADI